MEHTTLLRRPKRFSIFAKLVLAFLAVMVPLYLLGAFTNQKGIDIIRHDISQSLKQKDEFYLLSLETEIERMTVLQREFLNDDDLITLSTLADTLSVYKRLSALNRLQAKLRLMKSSSPYIEKAKAYIPSLAKEISSNDYVEELGPEELHNLKQVAPQAILPIIQSGDRFYIRNYYPSAYHLDERDPAFVLELELSAPALRRFLQQLPGYERGGALLWSENLSISGSSEPESARRIQEELGLALRGADEPGPGEEGTVTRTVSLPDGPYLTESAWSDRLNAYLTVYVPENEVMGQIERYKWYQRLISVFALAVAFIFAYWIYRVIHQPLRKLVSAFRKVESGVMRVNIRHRSNDEFHYLYDKFNGMVSHLDTLIYETYEQKIHLQQSELKQLQSQINPHFLYNSFYLLYRMTKARDFEHATRFTKFLGDYFQYITRNGAEEVRLEEELAHIRAYTEIQSIRFQGRIRVVFGAVPARCREAIVPRLILQPIVENVYEHGFDHERDECLLELDAREMRSEAGEPLLTLEVRDNGKGLTDAERAQLQRKFDYDEGEVTGIVNVHRRLRLKYGPGAGIRLARAESGGLIVALTIPLQTKEMEAEEEGGGGGG